MLAAKVDRGDRIGEHAVQIGRQILRDNALALFPAPKEPLGKGKAKLTPPVTSGPN